jgi:hypothetical protein
MAGAFAVLVFFVDAIEGKSALLASGADSFWTDWIIKRALRKKRG